MTLPRSLERAEWYGRGPQENYWDRLSGAAVGRYASPVGQLAHIFARPQEAGNRTDTRWLALSDREGRGLLAVGCLP